MLNRLFFLLVCILFSVVLYAQMSDEQVVKLLQDAQKQGMSQQEVIMMLTQKGVTQEQILRIKDSYTGQGGDPGRATQGESLDRMRNGTLTPLKGVGQKEEQSVNGKGTQRYVKEELPNGKMLDSIRMGLRSGTFGSQKKSDVFGRDIFNNQMLTFEPNLNMATPENYVLGPGDEVFVDIWGDSQESLRQKISPDGNIHMDKLGPVYLAGLTVQEANSRLKNLCSRIFSTINGSNPTTFVRLSLGEIRTIQVNVMGEVVMPGTYSLPSLASLFHALYSAGGVNDLGTLRCVKLNRGGKEIAVVDIYEYLQKGKSQQNMGLKDGDVIVVSPYQQLIKIKGKVKRPMTYELREGETMGDLLDYAGNFSGDAYRKAVRVIRKSGREHQVYNVGEPDFRNFVMTDGDEVSVDSVLSRFENRVEVRGAVYRAGLYALGDGLVTMRDLISKAEGVRGDAFLAHAVLYREKKDLTTEAESVDVAEIIGDEQKDITLRNGDVLYIPSIFDLKEDYTITVHGAVGFPGVYRFVENMSLEDLIVQSGGLKESASVVRVDVARRLKDPKSTDVNKMLSENYTLNLKDGLQVGTDKKFVLSPFDEIYVRNSPGYEVQKNVSVDGEVLFGGKYVLAMKGERLSDLIRRAGGLTPEAYPQGAQLLRKLNKDEQARVQSMLKLARQGGKDSVDMSRLDLGEYYTVGIELDKALKNPGSDHDVVLREDDRISIPRYSGTVKISGAVMYPNTVIYQKNEGLKYYVNQGGGFASRARRHRVFVVYMNGMVSKSKAFRNAKIQPGCEVIVPLKQERRRMGLAEIMSLASSTTSMAAMVASMINITK